MIFRLTSLDSVFVSAAVAAGALIATSATEVHRDVSFRGSAKDSDGELQSSNKNVNAFHIPRKLADKNGVVDKKGLDLSLHMENREEKTTINTGRNRQLRNINTKYFVSPTDDAGDQEDSIAVDTSTADNIIDIGILHGNAVPFNAEGERNLDQDGTADRDQYCLEMCGSDRKEIPAGKDIYDLITFCRNNDCICDDVPEGVEINYRCPSELKCWDTSQITDMHYAFGRARSDYGSLRCWDVSSVTNMDYMFIFTFSNFNIGNINDWDVSSVTSMAGMFMYSFYFNSDVSEYFKSDVSGWNTSSVQNTQLMFHSSTFNQPINTWSTSSVTNMLGMFSRAKVFNQDIGSWDVSSVTSMQGLFQDALEFDQYIGGWNVSSVIYMNQIFETFAGDFDFIGGYQITNKFNQFIGNWDVSSVVTMDYAFRKNYEFNQSLQSWDLSSVTGMRGMFFLATSFNQPVDVWDVSSVNTMRFMFYGASSFNQCLSSWEAKITNDNIDLERMFRYTSCPAGIYTPVKNINGPWCQDSSNQCYEATCVDDPEFQFNGDDSKNCEWVAFGESSEKRCAKEGVFEACSQTCNPVCFGGCDDDPNFQLNGVKAKNCDWVAKQKTKERCKKPGVMDACRATCSNSNLDPKCATVAVDCTDDPNFQLNGVKGKNCVWVAKQKTDERCMKPSVMASCRLTCNPSCGCKDSMDQFQFQGSIITCKDLDIMDCGAEPTPSSDEFSLAQLTQLEALLDPIHQRLDTIENAVVGFSETPNKDRKTFMDLCPNKCKKCVS